MDLHVWSDDERRAHCRRELEALEHWLRRLVHETFSAIHGDEYLDATYKDGRRFIKKEIAHAIADRRTNEPLRYRRPIDATHLDELVTILCNPENWSHHFRAALLRAFPQENDEAREFLRRLVGIRNKLAHADPISVHEAARAVCYTWDVIEALKGYYMERNVEKEYNAPTIIRVIDSLGNVAHASDIRRDTAGVGRCDFRKRTTGAIRPGERLSIQVEIDPTFYRSEYKVDWWPIQGSAIHENDECLIIDIKKAHVNNYFDIHCAVTSNKDWRKLGKTDDLVVIIYKVLPPLS